MYDEAYLVTIDGRRVTYVGLAYGLDKGSKLVQLDAHCIDL